MRREEFIFEKYEADKAKGEFRFYYSLGGEIDFVEKLSVDRESVIWKNVNRELLDAVLFNSHLMLGISYWKTYCPEKITVNSGKLNKEQAEFWNKLYTNGLGEFFYKNKIDFRGLVKFPYSGHKTVSVKFKAKDRAIVPFGGGKDSAVTAELLKRNKNDFILFGLNTSRVQRQAAKIAGKKTVIIKRELDKGLFKLNKAGAYNGHIPITAVYSFVSLLASALYNYKYIVFSNEQSANYGNLKYLNHIVNHQYSKSFEFENDFRAYLKKYISPDIVYFSLLRPFSEFKIAELFSEHKKYFDCFSSCNRNFTINGKSEKRWCGKCPKCAFVFSQLSAFVPKKELIKIFGKNLYQDKKLLSVFLELWEEKKIKPFDCVGEEEEVLRASYAALNAKEYDNDYIINYFKSNILPKRKDMAKKFKKEPGQSREHNIPTEFTRIIKNL